MIQSITYYYVFGNIKIIELTNYGSKIRLFLVARGTTRSLESGCLRNGQRNYAAITNHLWDPSFSNLLG